RAQEGIHLDGALARRGRTRGLMGAQLFRNVLEIFPVGVGNGAFGVGRGRRYEHAGARERALLEAAHLEQLGALVGLRVDRTSAHRATRFEIRDGLLLRVRLGSDEQANQQRALHADWVKIPCAWTRDNYFSVQDLELRTWIGLRKSRGENSHSMHLVRLDG